MFRAFSIARSDSPTIPKQTMGWDCQKSHDATQNASNFDPAGFAAALRELIDKKLLYQEGEQYLALPVGLVPRSTEEIRHFVLG